jgi:hypothetical protein
MGSLDLQNIAAFRSKMCTDTPLVYRLGSVHKFAWSYQLGILNVLAYGAVRARHPPRRTVTPSSLQRGLVVRLENLPVILHDGQERDFSPVVQCGVYSVYAAFSFALTVPSVVLHDA